MHITKVKIIYKSGGKVTIPINNSATQVLENLHGQYSSNDGVLTIGNHIINKGDVKEIHLITTP